MRPKQTPGESSAGPYDSHPPEFAVKLSDSIRRQAEQMAIREGISLEDFVLYAVAEKIARSEPPDQT